MFYNEFIFKIQCNLSSNLHGIGFEFKKIQSESLVIHLSHELNEITEF